MTDRQNPGGYRQDRGRFEQNPHDPRQNRAIGKIDSHHHLWHFKADEFEWIHENQTRLRRDYLIDELKSAAGPQNVIGAVSVQARQTVAETDFLLEQAESYDFIRGIVGWLPLASDDIARNLERYAARPKFRGLRHVIQDEPDSEFMLAADFNRGVDKLLAYGLAFDLLVQERQLREAIRFVDLHPYQTFVLDHCGKPRIADGEIEEWRGAMQELAERINVYCKVSGLATEARRGDWKPEDLIPYIDAVFDLFGPERVMFGSDWPVCLLGTEYADWVNLCASVVGSFSQSEQRRFWAETAREAYRL